MMRRKRGGTGPADRRDWAVVHVTSAMTLTERTMTIQVKVEGANAQPLAASVTARTDVPVRSKEEGAPEGAPQFLSKLAGQLDPEMSAEWAVTKQPRKQLAYSCEYEDAEEGGRRTGVLCAIHHGGYAPEWRPLAVYVAVTARDTARRDKLEGIFKEKLAKKLLPLGTKVTPSGAITVTARVDFPWATSEDLNDALAGQVLVPFRRLRDELVPLLEE